MFKWKSTEYAQHKCISSTHVLQAALEAAGIVPDEDKTYATSDIEDALAAAWGAKPEVMCSCTPGGWRQECQEALIDSVSPIHQHPHCCVW